MNKKAFTLVELLGVIVVLTLILLVSAPSIIETFRQSSIKEYNAFLTSLYNATETYIEFNRDAFDQLDTVNGKVDVSLQTLLDLDYIKKLGVNPDTGLEVDANYTVVATKLADGTIDYSITNLNTDVSDYAASGLLVHYDSINNLGIGHSNTTTIWNDLSDYHSDGSLANFNNIATSGWTNSGLVFDGTNDIVTLDTVSLGTIWTIEANITYVNQSKTYEFFMGTTHNTGAYGKLLFRYNSNLTYSYPVNTYNSLTTTSASISNIRKTISFVSNGTTVKVYVDGVLGGSYTISAPMMVNLIGNAWTDSLWQTKMTLHSLRIYNVALTTNQMLANTALDTNRYR